MPAPTSEAPAAAIFRWRLERGGSTGTALQTCAHARGAVQGATACRVDADCRSEGVALRV